ncbi:MAG: hypothetical protein Q7S01_04630 [bacterium]|nr:hypothetical protein [bacterium]
MFSQENESNKERVIPDLVVQTAASPGESYKICADFIEKMRTRYPKRNYLLKGIIDNLDPDKHPRTPISYFGKVKEEIVGIIVGEKEGDVFNGYIFLVDQKYQNTNVAVSLMRSLQADESTIKLVPAPIGMRKYTSPEQREHLTRALERYYKRFGFVPSSNHTMVWHRGNPKKNV